MSRNSSASLSLKRLSVLLKLFILEIKTTGLSSAFRKFYIFIIGKIFYSHLPEDAVSISSFPVSSKAIKDPEARAIAFYLPQFHQIPENDAWWGEGFTEWVNVKRAKSFSLNHYQPHVPHQDVGYYDLLDPSVLERQAEMARQAGIFGFCFYHYWFASKRLLEMPVERMLKSGKPSFNFCLCWANENWSRRWDGSEQEILMAQQHSEKDDLNFIYDLLPAFRDPRYIRVNGCPLFLVYRPTLLPYPSKTFEQWRKICHKEGIGEIHLLGVASFESYDYLHIGLDGIINFPPHQSGCSPISKFQNEFSSDFCGDIYDYYNIRRNMLARMNENRKLTIYQGIMPSWDNTPRRRNRGAIITRSSPSAYYAWLKQILKWTCNRYEKEQRLIFINAWNEWAEGCHLEPDEFYGYAWLNATRQALVD